MWLDLKTNCNSNAFSTLLLVICTSICMWKFYFPPTEHRHFIHHDNHGLPRSQLQRFPSLASVTQRESASLSTSSKILRKWLIRCPPVSHHLWPAGEVIMYLYDGSRRDCEGRVARKGRELERQLSFWFLNILIEVTYLWCTPATCHIQCKALELQYVIKCQPNEVVTVIVSISQVRKLSYREGLNFSGFMRLVSWKTRILNQACLAQSLTCWLLLAFNLINVSFQP